MSSSGDGWHRPSIAMSASVQAAPEVAAQNESLAANDTNHRLSQAFGEVTDRLRPYGGIDQSPGDPPTKFVALDGVTGQT